jgi:hypothetical protein
MPADSPPSPVTSPPPPPAPREGSRSAPRRGGPPRWLLALGAVIVVAAITFGAISLFGGDDDADTLEIGKPRVVSEADLSSYAHSAGRPVYWAGPAAEGYKLELTETEGQRVFVRYLSDSAEAGDPRATFTTVATYPMPAAADKLRSYRTRAGAVPGKTEAGAETLYYKKTPSSVYVAGENSDYLIEVYAPQPKDALELAQSSSIVQVP